MSVAAGLGHGPMGWHPPNGYPDVAAAWNSPSTTLGLWNAHLKIASGSYKTGLSAPDLPGLAGPGTPATAGELLDRLSAALLGQRLAAQDRQAFLDFLGSTATTPVRSADAKLLPVLAALMLDSPYWSAR